jgi:glucosamine-6-phosphate deaminase
VRVFIAANYHALSTEAARLIQDTLSSKPDAVLGLPTGRTPLGMYRELDLSGVTAFGLDEYLGVAPTDPRSFTAYLRKYVGIDRLRMPSTDYEREIENAGGIDLLILGIGTNGHIAFNEPGSAFDSRTRVVELADSTIEPLRAVFAEDELPRQGITMGIATILSARRIVLLASGADKAAALSAALRGPLAVECPASALRLHPDVTVIADQDAAFTDDQNCSDTAIQT